MDKKTLTELDFYRIRDEISGFCASEESVFIMQRLEPLRSPEEIKERKALGREWTLYFSAGASSKGGCASGSSSASKITLWPPVFNTLKSLKVSGIVLSLAQVYELGQFVKSIEKITYSVKHASEKLNLKDLVSLLESIPDTSAVSSLIFQIITPEGELRDLPSIRAIRERIASLNQKLKGLLHSFTGNQKYADVLESTVPVLRGGRQVLAVKAGRRSSIPGIIHELSASGQTVYIEPEECVLVSNELVEAEFELDTEVRKILCELTEKLSEYAEDLKTALKIMEKLDITSAAALWGKANGCIWAEDIENALSGEADALSDGKTGTGGNVASGEKSGSEEPLTILKARHPLLREKAVPIDVRFMKGKRVLIITGPNTGGKTVTLKTIALFVLLNQAGFPVPAGEGTRLPFFSGVFADIGDSQSMDESLSTFSGHMKNIARAVNFSDEKSLVLLDELGSGTDPLEGSAISMAVLDRLIEKKAFVLITTHQGVIKNYGYTKSECINASVEFNSESLSPTYKILMGVPGESHALEIAKKSGLPGQIVKAAAEYIVSEKADVSSLIKGLTQKHAEMDELTEKLKEREEELNSADFKNREKALELSEKEHRLNKSYQTETQVFLEESRKKLENLVRVLREGEITREKTLGVKRFIASLEEEAEEIARKIEEEEEELTLRRVEIQELSSKRVSHKKTKKKVSNKEALKNAESLAVSDEERKKLAPSSAVPAEEPLVFRTGQDVVVTKTKTPGVITAEKGKGKWLVQLGAISMVLKQSELTLVRHQLSSVPDYEVCYSEGSAGRGEVSRPEFELRLLGLRAEEAVKKLERQIDLCIIHNFKNFSIIHGKGTGALQQTVRDYLSQSVHVKDYQFAPPEDGGFGKTYVELY